MRRALLSLAVLLTASSAFAIGIQPIAVRSNRASNVRIVAAAAFAPGAINSTSPVATIKFDEGAGTTITDVGGSNVTCKALSSFPSSSFWASGTTGSINLQNSLTMGPSTGTVVCPNSTDAPSGYRYSNHQGPSGMQTIGFVLNAPDLTINKLFIGKGVGTAQAEIEIGYTNSCAATAFCVNYLAADGSTVAQAKLKNANMFKANVSTAMVISYDANQPAATRIKIWMCRGTGGGADRVEEFVAGTGASSSAGNYPLVFGKRMEDTNFGHGNISRFVIMNYAGSDEVANKYCDNIQSIP